MVRDDTGAGEGGVRVPVAPGVPGKARRIGTLGAKGMDPEESDSQRCSLAEAQARTLETEHHAMEQRPQEPEHQLNLLKRQLFQSRSENLSAEKLEARLRSEPVHQPYR